MRFSFLTFSFLMLASAAYSNGWTLSGPSIPGTPGLSGQLSGDGSGNSVARIPEKEGYSCFLARPIDFGDAFSPVLTSA